MEIRTVREGGVLVAMTEDRIDGNNAQQFQDNLEAVIDNDDLGVVLDMEQLTFIGSAGLRVIMINARKLQRRNMGFALCALSGNVREIFEISGFDKIVSVHVTRANAVAALQK